MDDEVRAFIRVFQRFVSEALRGVGREPDERLRDVLDEHLGARADGVPVVVEAVPAHRWADADIALAGLAGEDPGSRLVGVSGGPQRHPFSLADLASGQGPIGEFGVGQVDYRNVPVGPHEERATVAFGMYLFSYRDRPVVVCQRAANPQWGDPEARFEVMAADSENGSALLAELRERALAASVLRGQVITFTARDGRHYGQVDEGVAFLERPDVPAEQVILPPRTLDRLHEHVLGMGQHRDRLLALGQHLKRGVLLYGPPGTGKTHTVRHLIGADPDTTVIIMSGPALGRIGDAATIARAHQPALVVIEDCDLIAMERDLAHGPQPLLFQLLDAMDGLDADADVVFLLTTNRPELLERALTQRPGRVDLAAALPLPDEAARLRLLHLYAGRLELSEQALRDAARRTEGVPAAFIKELARRAALPAATTDRHPADADLNDALDTLLADNESLTRALLGSTDAAGRTPAQPPYRPRPPASSGGGTVTAGRPDP